MGAGAGNRNVASQGEIAVRLNAHLADARHLHFHKVAAEAGDRVHRYLGTGANAGASSYEMSGRGAVEEGGSSADVHDAVAGSSGSGTDHVEGTVWRGRTNAG